MLKRQAYRGCHHRNRNLCHNLCQQTLSVGYFTQKVWGVSFFYKHAVGQLQILSNHVCVATGGWMFPGSNQHVELRSSRSTI